MGVCFYPGEVFMLRIQIAAYLVFLLLTACFANAARAAEANNVRWFNDVSEAWRASQSQGRPLLVFVTRADCVPCARMKLGTYTDSVIATTINDRFVAVTIDAARPSPLLKDLAVNAYPATFVISPQAVILQRIDGYVTPDQMSARLAKIAPETIHPPSIRTVSGRAF
jgi:thioredoxin-related protein